MYIIEFLNYIFRDIKGLGQITGNSQIGEVIVV
jgi:hypothetical protein